jgi:hypothetical protein
MLKTSSRWAPKSPKKSHCQNLIVFR